jgi:hypothetical protein
MVLIVVSKHSPQVKVNQNAAVHNLAAAAKSKKYRANTMTCESQIQSIQGDRTFGGWPTPRLK